MAKFLLFATFLMGLLVSCTTQEIPVAPPLPGTEQTAVVDIGTDYRFQAFFSLEKGIETGRVEKVAWDLAFESGANAFRVWLNTSKMMRAAFFESATFSNKRDTLGFASRARLDASSGHPDSTAIGDWRVNDGIYLIDRGFDPVGRHLGFAKVRFRSVNSGNFIWEMASLRDTAATVLNTSANFASSRLFISLNNGQTILAAPPAAEWDLYFGQYTNLFPNEVPPLPYLVVGVLLNPINTFAAYRGEYGFEQANNQSESNVPLQSKIDLIGYDWKTFTGSNFITNTRKWYLVRTASGQLYKLRFIDFYGPQGNKGAINFKYQRL
jgi:hypothetical protein